MVQKLSEKNRKQFVTFNDYKSSELFIKHGVPQGSILEPILFFINDIGNISNKLFFLLFADDTNIFRIYLWSKY